MPIEGSDLFDLWIDHCTPEQAIEATLGRETCIYEIAAFGDGKAWFQCSECGGMATSRRWTLQNQCKTARRHEAGRDLTKRCSRGA